MDLGVENYYYEGKGRGMFLEEKVRKYDRRVRRYVNRVV